MKALPPVAPFLRDIKAKIRNIRTSKMLRDRMSIILALVALGINLLNFALLFIHSPSTKSLIPTHYSSFTGFEGVGPWYGPFNISLFGLTVTLLNSVIAVVMFSRSRLVSFYLLISACVVGMFCLIISNAFAVVGQ
jgi:hypothetical protein